jgi:hypothetical protein
MQSTQAAAAPSLGTEAVNYAVLSDTSITAGTGATVCNGDAGVPTGDSITGTMVCGSVNTTIDDADATQALTDLENAYSNLSTTAQPGGYTLPGDIGGYTIDPGLYTSGSSLGITGVVTLNANGITNPVFVFQIASALTTASAGTGTITASQVVLGSGVSAANVYWYVGAATTLGTYSVFQGNILSYAEIHVETGATMTGRALCENAVVALDTDSTVTRP